MLAHLRTEIRGPGPRTFDPIACRMQKTLRALCECNSVVHVHFSDRQRAARRNGSCVVGPSDANKVGTKLGKAEMMWHVVFAETGQLPRSRALRSRDAAIHAACELLAADCDVRRILEPNGATIERAELDGHYDEGRFPGLRRLVSALGPVAAGLQA